MFKSRMVYRGVPQKTTARAIIEVLERRQLLTATFVDTDGDLVTAQMTGGGVVTIDPVTRKIWGTGTTVTSVLTITVTRSATGDGLATMGEIRMFGPMLSINAPNIDVTHEVTTNDKNLPVAKTDKVSYNLGVMRNVAFYTGGQRVATLQVADWGAQPDGQELNAPTIDQFIITGRADVPGTAANEWLPGNMAAVMILGDSTTTASDYSCGSISIPGSLAEINATGRIGNMKVGVIHGDLQASSFGDISLRKGATGNITATGAPGVQTSISSIFAGTDLTSLTMTTSYGGIGEVWASGRIAGTTIRSADGIGGVDSGQGLYASRIQSLDSIDHIKVPGMGDDVIQVGVAPTFTGIATKASDFANLTASLGALRIPPGLPRNEAAVAATNVVSTPQLDLGRLRNIDDVSCLQIYVLNPSTPAVLSYLDTRDGYGFVWNLGLAEPTMLTEMLHHV